MKTFLGQICVVCAIVAACQTQVSVAQDNLNWTSDSLLVSEETAGNGVTACATCGQVSCSCQESNCDACCAFQGCDACAPYGIVGIFGIDTFHGNSENVLGSNFGAVTGLNAAMPVPGLSDRGIGWQLGMTYGVYRWDGKIDVEKTEFSSAKAQQQAFVTTGFFHKGDSGRLSYGLVYDWMINDQWGVVATSPTLGQWRGQVEYALSNSNAVGVYGCKRDLGSQQEIMEIDEWFTVVTRSISQINLFWHHKFCSGADSRVWFGIPDHGRFDAPGSLVDWIIGGQAEVPLSQSLALFANAQYIHPSCSAGWAASMEQYYDISAGVVWYVGGHARKSAINGGCWEPYLPVANNSTFVVEQGVAAIR